MATRAGERAEHVDESGSRNKREILDGLADIINEIAGIPAEEVHMGASFTDDLDVDSLSLVEVLVAAEERFNVRISDEDARHVHTVRAAVDYIARQDITDRN
ncbi:MULTISPECIES: acyl carrier protein [unclassified Streptomyces]|uniref:acyl carrier protein n=1 Tax=unclassified Streptomyces TaxID=2593676 RepID=UPI0036470D27